MRMIIYATLASAGLFGAGEYALGDDFSDLQPLIADVVPSSPGAETIIPYTRRVDIDGDGSPDRYTVRFRVYAGGSRTLLQETEQRGIPTPTLCDTIGQLHQNSAYWKVLRTPESSRLHFMVLLARLDQCADGETSLQLKSFIYSADPANTSGTVWTYAVSRAPTGFDSVDFDGDGNHEVMLTTWDMVDPSDPSSLDRNVVVRVMDPDTGAAITQNTYAQVR